MYFAWYLRLAMVNESIFCRGWFHKSVEEFSPASISSIYACQALHVHAINFATFCKIHIMDVLFPRLGCYSTNSFTTNMLAENPPGKDNYLLGE